VVYESVLRDVGVVAELDDDVVETFDLEVALLEVLDKFYRGLLGLLALFLNLE